MPANPRVIQHRGHPREAPGSTPPDDPQGTRPSAGPGVTADAAGGPPAPPPLVTVDLWRVPTRRVGGALGRVTLGQARLRRVPGLRFARLVGTGSPGAFTPLDAEPRRWGLVAVWDNPAAARAFAGAAMARSWERIAEEHFHVELRPVAWRGRWSGREPFGPPPVRPGPAGPPDTFGHPPVQSFPAAPDRAPQAPGALPGLVAVLTRARLVPRRAVAFWRAAPPVAADLAALAAPATGLAAPGQPAAPAGLPTGGPLLALGIGEAPIGLQGTFSVWPDLAAVREFAYRRPAHAAVVNRTAEAGWYAEELFARFAVLRGHGTVDGRDPLRRS